MKLTKIFSIVLGLHVVLIGFLAVMPGCKSTSETVSVANGEIHVTGTIEPAEPSSGEIHPDFNAGMTASAPPRESRAGRHPPTRPTWDMGPSALDNSGSGEVLQPLATMSEFTNGPNRSYTVQRGDSLWGIAKANGITLAELLSINGFDRDTTIYPSQEILIPGDSGSARGGGMRLSELEIPKGVVKYTVQSGDSLSRIATRFGTRVAAIKSINNLTSDLIRVGQVLNIRGADRGVGPTASSVPRSSGASLPVAGFGEDFHIVKAGETPGEIARKYGMKAEELMEKNGISDPRKMRVGQTLVVRSSGVRVTVPEPERREAVESALPSIEELERSLLGDDEPIPVIPVDSEE
jgi:LysM repeat protein